MSFNNKIESIIDGLKSRADSDGIELLIDDPFDGDPSKEGLAAIIHNINSNQFGLVATDIEEIKEPISFFLFNGKLFDYCKMEGFSREDMVQGPGFKNKVLRPVDMKEFVKFMLK